MEIMAKARLANDPRSIQTKTGTEMATSFAFLDIEGESGLPVGLVAFNRLAGALLKYRKGDNVRITGTMKANNWTDKEGVEQKGFQVVVDALMGVEAAGTQYQEHKPKGDQQRNQASQDFYDDALPDF